MYSIDVSKLDLNEINAVNEMNFNQLKNKIMMMGDNDQVLWEISRTNEQLNRMIELLDRMSKRIDELGKGDPLDLLE